MRPQELFDETFDACQTGHYDLILIPEYAALTLVVHDAVRNQFIGVGRFESTDPLHVNYSVALRQCTEVYPWTQGEFHSIRVANVSREFTLLPSAYYVPEKAKSVLSAVVPVPTLGVIYRNILPSDISLIFATSGEWVQSVQHMWPAASFYHVVSGLTAFAMQLFRREEGCICLLHPSLCVLLFASHGAIRSAVPIDPLSPADVLYLMLSGFEAHAMDPKESSYCVLGSSYVSTNASKDIQIVREELDEYLSGYINHCASRMEVEAHPQSYCLSRQSAAWLPYEALLLCE